MTLSYRWNDEHPAKLSTTNYSGLIQRIPIVALPRVFLDAMMVARRLGIFYLWIDSLCIMQDSLSDWQRESSHMADIYAGSWCNISAMSGLDSLHVSRNPFEVQGCTFKDESSSTTFRVRAHDDGFRHWDQSITKSPLQRRGWILQELTLGPRTLHFGLDRVFFQCKTQKTSEASPTDLDITTKRYQPAPLSLTLPFKKHWGPPGWAEIVHQYTRRILTFPERDKLVAISGLAQRHGPPEEYLAGLWKKDILFQLPWRVLPTPHPQKQKQKQNPIPPKNPQAPSWTWASTNHPILSNSHPESKSHLLSPLTTFLKADILPAAGDIYGQLSKGTLYLEAPLIEVEIHRVSPRSYTARYYRGSAFSFPVFDISSSSTGRSISLDFEEDFLPSQNQEPVEREAEPTPTYLLPLYHHIERNTKKKIGLQALIVKPTGVKPREFVRKGVVYLEGVWWVENLGKCCRGFLGAVEDEVYEGLVGEKEGMPIYEVCLV